MKKLSFNFADEWEKAVLVFTIFLAISAIILWAASFLLSPGQPEKKATSQTGPARLFDEKALSFRQAPAIPEQTNTFHFQIQLPRRQGNNQRQHNQTSQPGHGPAVQPAAQTRTAAVSPAGKAAAAASGENNDAPPPPPHVITLTYLGFYQGVSGLPQAMLSQSDSRTPGETNAWLSAGTKIAGEALTVLDLTEEELTVSCLGETSTIPRGTSASFTIP